MEDACGPFDVSGISGGDAGIPRTSQAVKTSNKIAGRNKICLIPSLQVFFSRLFIMGLFYNGSYFRAMGHTSQKNLLELAHEAVKAKHSLPLLRYCI